MYWKSKVLTVEIFRTNVGKRKHANNIIRKLLREFPNSIIHFDLEDCDRILRFESTQVIPSQIIALLHEDGYVCEILL
jgi:tRNA G26 N,N-dimethylase Trm1